MKTLFVFLLALTTTSSAHAYLDFRVEGSCTLQKTKEVIAIQPVDPLTHYGMFARGESTQGDFIYLADHSFDNRIVLSMSGGTERRGHLYAHIKMDPQGTTEVLNSLWVGEGENSDWLSCDLKVTATDITKDDSVRKSNR